MEAIVGKEGGAAGGVDNVGLPGLPGTRPMSPRGSFGHSARDCCVEETSRRGNAAGSHTSAHRVPRSGRCRGRGSARCANLDPAAMTKLHAEEKDAFAINKRDLGDGIVAVRSTLGARRDSGGGRTAHATEGERVGIIGSSRDVVTCASSFHSSCGSSRACMSYLDAVSSAPARAPAAGTCCT